MARPRAGSGAAPGPNTLRERRGCAGADRAAPGPSRHGRAASWAGQGPRPRLGAATPRRGQGGCAGQGGARTGAPWSRRASVSGQGCHGRGGARGEAAPGGRHGWAARTGASCRAEGAGLGGPRRGQGQRQTATPSRAGGHAERARRGPTGRGCVGVGAPPRTGTVAGEEGKKRGARERREKGLTAWGRGWHLGRRFRAAGAVEEGDELREGERETCTSPSVGLFS
eukprot:XP_020400865.1 uncharacterized protein LOC109942754 [Zea mays]